MSRFSSAVLSSSSFASKGEILSQVMTDRLDGLYGKWDLMNTYAAEDNKPKLGPAEETPATPHRPVTV